MGASKTRRTAQLSVKHMEKINLVPKTILNIGVGSAPELPIWIKSYPEAALVGVDIRGWRKWIKLSNPSQFVFSLIGNKESTGEGSFCWRCHSRKCTIPEHEEHKKPCKDTRTIDNIVSENAENIIEPPYFMWIDIEGGELDALKGSILTLPQTPLINIEMREFKWTNNNNCTQLHAFLTDHGYKLIDQTEEAKKANISNLEDKLYQRIDWKY